MTSDRQEDHILNAEDLTAKKKGCPPACALAPWAGNLRLDILLSSWKSSQRSGYSQGLDAQEVVSPVLLTCCRLSSDEQEVVCYLQHDGQDSKILRLEVPWT